MHTVRKFLVVSVVASGLASGSLYVQDHHDDHRDDHHQNHPYVHHEEWKHGYDRNHDDRNRGERIDYRGERIDYRTDHLRQPPRATNGVKWTATMFWPQLRQA